MTALLLRGGCTNMPIDPEGAKIEEAMWQCLPQLRWYRPRGATDDEKLLQQLWERITGERHWRTVPYMLED